MRLVCKSAILCRKNGTDSILEFPSCSNIFEVLGHLPKLENVIVDSKHVGTFYNGSSNADLYYTGESCTLTTRTGDTYLFRFEPVLEDGDVLLRLEGYQALFTSITDLLSYAHHVLSAQREVVYSSDNECQAIWLDFGTGKEVRRAEIVKYIHQG